MTDGSDVLLQDDMRVRSAEAERAHPCRAWGGSPILAYRGLPWSQLIGDVERRPLEIDVGVNLLQMNVRRDLLVLDGEQDLEDARDAGRGLQVADVGFYRAKTA